MVPFAWHGFSGLVQMGARPANCEAPGLVQAVESPIQFLQTGVVGKEGVA